MEGVKDGVKRRGKEGRRDGMGQWKVEKGRERDQKKGGNKSHSVSM